MSLPSRTLPTPATRVVLVDVRDDRREVMRHVVDGDDGKAMVVGDASSRASALELVQEQRADAVIIDVRMPVPEGLVTIAARRARHPALGIIVCSFDLDAATVEQVLAHGADSCRGKPVRRADVQDALNDLPHRDRPAGSAGAPVPALHVTREVSRLSAGS